MATEAQIRYATQEDVSEIIAMIKELAIFEKELSSVEATEEHLLKTMSFPTSSNPGISDFTHGYARAFMLTAPTGEVAGFALYFTTYSTWTGAPGIWLEDLFVRPDFRRRGYAEMLLKRLSEESIKIGGKRLDWVALKWNEGALTFYNKIGAKRMDDWVQLRLDGDKLSKMAGQE